MASKPSQGSEQEAEGIIPPSIIAQAEAAILANSRDDELEGTPSKSNYAQYQDTSQAPGRGEVPLNR
jgi:hypothetical protein